MNFLKWWARKTTTWIIILAIITVAQIPHMVWNADLYLEIGVISHVHPIIDFILYGIDLIEIPSIMIAIMTIIARMKHKNEVIS